MNHKFRKMSDDELKKELEWLRSKCDYYEKKMNRCRGKRRSAMVWFIHSANTFTAKSQAVEEALSSRNSSTTQTVASPTISPPKDDLVTLPALSLSSSPPTRLEVVDQLPDTTSLQRLEEASGSEEVESIITHGSSDNLEESALTTDNQAITSLEPISVEEAIEKETQSDTSSVD